ncbi:LOW QUALITY PROTEIN: pentatricopeptide repeat-containing protein At1g11290, chloroplastic [Cryptomeria japonica]|uniref:LOW QUALITY PROTEIN: pentatricopeptide repeat-containing protein At1g11290, chloroplastic n=1 Tax=Cryptomeria japonica TaxID=3369 RepID=UPI0027DA715F|nr:LOW QUALITY PROTEIN: pentatricopeptide repeat-containing protein At1g11290, chloroplastic [Cryptomeria japonica]
MASLWEVSFVVNYHTLYKVKHYNRVHRRLFTNFNRGQNSRWITRLGDSKNNTYRCDLIACASLLQTCKDVRSINQVHAQVFIAGLYQNIFLGSKLVNMYAMYSSMDYGRQVFDRMPDRDVCLWNVLIRGYARNGPCEEALALYYQMQEHGVQPDKFTFPFVLKACAELSALQQGKKIHEDIVGRWFEKDIYVGNSLVAMYAKCGKIDIAREVFNKMSERDVVSWTALIDGLAQNGNDSEALILFDQMVESGFEPNQVTLLCVLQACGRLGALQQGEWIHDKIIQRGLLSNVKISNSLVAMYAKCGNVRVARQLFDSMSRTDLVSWNSMIAGYSQNGHASEALELFQQMQLANVRPCSLTMVSLLQSCAHLIDLGKGECIHAYVVRSGFLSDIVLTTALVNMYAKCGNIASARDLFAIMPRRNEVCWNAIIAGHVHNGEYNEALTFFNQMQLTDVKPNHVTMIGILPACAHLASLNQGKVIHGYIIKSGLESDVLIGNSIIDMYNKCGSLCSSREMFNKMFQRDVVSWNTIISGYGIHGRGEDALALFSQMQQTDIKPDFITFICVLSACSHAGLVEKGWKYFECMDLEYGITPNSQHYACIVDLLGRAGYLDAAKHFIEKMPGKPGASVWGALLGACRIHHNILLGEWVAEHLFHLEPDKAAHHVLLSNIYAAAGRWGNVSKIRTLMKVKGIKRSPGCSLIHVNNKIHSFIVGDTSHPQSVQIYEMLRTLTREMENAGYVPSTNLVLHDVEEEVKEHMLYSYSHSEKLAIAFGLISTSPGMPITIIKNLRVCIDCHDATKFISKIVNREIILRDSNRFHHFKDGSCSCRDYW